MGYWKVVAVHHLYLSACDPCFTVIHRLDMSTSVNEKPHVNERFPPAVRPRHSSDGLIVFIHVGLV